MLYCFLDTNIFLEFRPITEINWVKELNTSSVCLVVTSVVIREMDKHKSGSSNRLRKRARRSLTHLENLDVKTDNEIRDGVSLRFDLSEPKQATLESNNLSAYVPDDILLAKVIEFRAEHRSTDVAIVSDDRTVRLKARGYDLDVPALSDDYRLPHEIDPLEQENRELRNELLRLRNRQPKLSIGFRGADQQTRECIRRAVRFEDDLISEASLNETIEQKRNELQLPREIAEVCAELQAVPDDSPMSLSTRVRKYQEHVSEYLEGSFRAYVYQKSLHRVFLVSSIRVPLTLENSGTIPARGIELTLRIEDIRELLSGKPDLFEYPVPPRQPTWRPTHNDYLLNGASDYCQSNLISAPGTDSDLWVIEESEASSAKVAKCYFEQFTHHKLKRLDELFLIADKPAKFPATVEISFEIIAENVIEKITGQLTVVINEFAP